jgi:EAL domain-containing protein (putative c-di-GMP-specific phosphodiesterase class I)
VTQPERIRVIVAEDDDTVREALTDLIQATPTLELIAAVADATQAVEVAGAVQPHVAVVDVRMPGGGGPRAARGIARRSPGTRVLALSASNDRASVTKMLEAGAVGYLTKGIATASIVESIEAAAAGRATLSAEVTAGVIEELVERRQVERRGTERARARRRRIEHAIDDRAAFEIHYQPIYELDGDLVLAVEALARFHGPPVRTPDRWFAEAAEVGLGLELELAAAARALEGLTNLPPAVNLMLNASPRTVLSAGFHTLLAESEPERIVIEITEHASIDDYAPLTDALTNLRELGVRLAVDDAGAGFASLRHILTLDPQFIKLDRTLIDGIVADRPRQALAAGLISFAERTDTTIIAEGIERREEIETLRQLGVAYGQGYFLARPAPLPIPRRAHAHAHAD